MKTLAYAFVAAVSMMLMSSCGDVREIHSRGNGDVTEAKDTEDKDTRSKAEKDKAAQRKADKEARGDTRPDGGRN